MAGEDPKYIEWIRRQDCCACGGKGPCEPHHSTNGEAESSPKGLGGRRGLSQRAHDHESMPLHVKCHRQVHDCRGFSEGWDRARRRAWQDDMVRVHRSLYEREGPSSRETSTSTEPKKPRPTVKQEAEGIAAHHSLGPQVTHDIERLLKKALRGEIAP